MNPGSAFAVQGWRGKALSPRPQIEHIRKPQILSAAAEGAGSTERAGTSAPAVLYWFENKDVLLAEALTFDEDRFDAVLDGRLATLTSPAAKLVALIEACAHDDDWQLDGSELIAARSASPGRRQRRGVSPPARVFEICIASAERLLGAGLPGAPSAEAALLSRRSPTGRSRARPLLRPLL